MPAANTLSGIVPNETLAKFEAELAELLSRYDLADLALVKDDGREESIAAMKLHRDETAPNFHPARHDDAPQYLTMTVQCDGRQIPAKYDGKEYMGNRAQISFNFYRAVPSDWKPNAEAAKVEKPKPEGRTALTADQIKSALSSHRGVVVANPGK